MDISEHSEYQGALRPQPLDPAQLYRLKNQLDREPHLFIVLLGAVIGVILALFISYHLKVMLFSLVCLVALPVTLAYFLRRVYIYTLLHYQD